MFIWYLLSNSKKMFSLQVEATLLLRLPNLRNTTKKDVALFMNLIIGLNLDRGGWFLVLKPTQNFKSNYLVQVCAA